MLDKNLKPVPIGVPGELYTSGDGVANGYLNRDELTRDVFVHNPYQTTGDEVLYKTGDLVRYYEDGNIEYLGRIDQQVKIRGFRIELSEVEDAIARINTVREVAVIAREDVPRVKRLVAYFVPVDDFQPTAMELKSELKQMLPDYMVPSAFVAMESLPVTANGKLDRKALPKPENEGDVALQRVPPRTEKEIILADIWKQVLNLEEVGIRDNFFEMGGDSILSIQIISRAKVAGLHLTTKQIFENQTIEELAEVASEVESPILAEQGLVMGDAPLSPIQHWFFNHEFKNEHHWNQSVLLDIRNEVALTDNQIQQALAAVVVQHDVLRTRFARSESGVAQFYSDSAQGADHFQLHKVDLESDDGAAVTAACDSLQASLNLEQGPLLLAGLINLPGNGRKLLLVLHHLVVDGVSWRILLEDFGHALKAVQAHDEVKLGFKTTSYKQWVESLTEFVRYGHLNQEMNYWLDIIEQEKPALPVDVQSGSIAVQDTVVLSSKLGRDVTQSLLRDVNKAYRTEINDVLLTALARTFTDWTGNDATLLDLEGHGREIFSDKIDLSRTVGWFTSVYPVRLHYEIGQPITDNLKSIKEQLRHIPGRGFGYGALRYLGEEKQSAGFTNAPAADIVFNYLGQFDSIIDNNPWFTLAQEDRGQEHSLESDDPHPLSINSHIVEGQLQVDWIYSSDIFDQELIQRLADQYLVAIEQLVKQCVRPDVFGYTPSDFPLAGLDQAQIDRLVGNDRSVVSVYPLSPMQEGMLFHSLFDNDHGVYFEQLSVEVLGSVDRELLKRAWVQVVNRHPALRSAFLWQELDRPLQLVYKEIDMEINELDWRHISSDQESMRLDAWLEKDRQRGFDFDKPGLMRLAWVDMPDNRSRLIWSFHHIVLDGWSLPLVMGEVFQTYGLLAKGEDATLPAAGNYEDFISYLEQVDKGDALQFWKLYLSEFEAATPLPNMKSNNGVSEKIFEEQHLKLDEAFTTRIQNFAREEHVTLNTMIQAAWGVLLSRYSGEKDVVFGTTVSGRPTDLPNVENIVGLFINTLPLRISLDERTTIGPLLKRMQEEQVDLRRFEFTPLVDIHRHSQVPGDQSLFDSILVFENYPVGEAVHSADELLDFGHITTIEHTNFPVTLIVEPANELLIKLSYDSSLFDYVAIERVLEHLRTLLHGMLSQPDVPLIRLPMLSETERNKVLHEWNPEPANYPRNLCLNQIFEKHAKAHPDRIAVISGDLELSYETLNHQANQLARYLIDNGVKPGDFVAIALQRSVEMLVSTLAVLKVGGAYVPVDPEYPDDRIIYMLQHTEAPVVISSQVHADRLQGLVGANGLDSGFVLLDSEASQIQTKSVENLIQDFAADPTRNAYVIYTSGSTGKPKGVLVNQLSVIRLVLDTNYVALTSEDRLCHSSNVSFDAATFEIWGPLLNGSTMVVYTKEQLLSPELFLAEVQRTKTNIAFMTTALFNMYVATQPEIIPHFKSLMVGGEPLDPSLVRKALKNHKPTHFINIYGPTENTTFSTFNELTYLPETATNVPIGRSISGSTVYILDANLQPVPIGVKGEIYVGGDGVAVGYLKDPERTAQSFIADPFSSNPNDRLYKTGDIARYSEDGLVEIMGRADDQVKIRGFRIELSEVESNLTRIDNVTDAVVLVKVDDANQKRLVAYVRTAQELTQSDIRTHALEYLPKHMIPAAFVLMEEFPLTSNGKVDKKALPEPVFEAVGSCQYVAARNYKEETLVTIWEQVLKADTVGIHDNFFELGGDSILSIQIISRAKRAGLHLTAKQIFDHQSIAELAEVAQELQDIILAEQGLVEGDVALTPIQHWFFDAKMADQHHFNQSVMLEVDSQISQEHIMAAFESILNQHDALRTRYEIKPDVVRQYLNSADKSESLLQEIFEVVNLSGLPENLRYEQLEQLSGQAQAGLNLETGPLMKVVYFSMGDGEKARLLVVIHHLIVDVFSWRVLLEDLQTAVGLLLKGARVDLGAKTTSFKQWSDVLLEWVEGAQLEADKAYWVDQLQCTPSVLQPDTSGTNLVLDARLEERKVGAELTNRLLKECSKAYQTEINDLLLAALARTLSKLESGSVFSVDLEGHGREYVADNIDVSRTVGWFTTVYPVVFESVADLGVGASVKTMKENLRRIPRKGFSFGLLKYLGQGDDLQVLRDFPASQISFNYLGQLDQVEQPDSMFVQASESTGDELAPAAQRKYLIDLSARVQQGELIVSWRYAGKMMDHSRIVALADSFTDELEDIIQHCSSGEHFGYTPSDFPMAQLSQQQLDELLPSTGVETLMPLSPVQEGMLFHALYEPGSWVYFDQIIVPIEGMVDEHAMFEAWETVVSRHQILRTGFIWENLTKPLQMVMKQVDLDINRYNWANQDPDIAEQKLQRLLIDDRNLGFNFKRPGVMRLSWISMPGNQHRLIWSFHHILLDGWSMPVVFAELFAQYESLASETEAALPTAPKYQDYIHWMHHQNSAEAHDFWKDYLAGFTATTPIPVKNSLAVTQHLNATEDTAARYKEQEVEISGSLLAGLQGLAKQHRLTLNHIMQGVWAVLLHRYSNESDVLFGTTVSGRPAELPGIEVMVGLFINTLPLRMQVEKEASFIDWLQAQQERNSPIKNYEFSSLVDVQKASELSAKQAMFESILVFENYPIDETLEETQASLKIGEVDAFQQTNFPLTLIIIPGKKLTLRFSYDSHLFTQATIERMLVHIEHMLLTVEGNPGIAIESLPLVSMREEQQLVQTWNDTSRLFASDATLVELFEQQVKNNPDQVACEFGQQITTYDLLNRRANRLARVLVNTGISPGTKVAVSFDRSLEMVEAMLAVLKAGCVYVPVDPSYPQDRVEHMISDTAAPVLITSAQLMAEYAYLDDVSQLQLRNIESLFEESQGLSDENLSIKTQAGSNALAYVIYTSGSTGKPKGVCVPQVAVSRLVLNTDYVELPQGHRMGHASNVSFDAATFEIWGALLNGGTLVGIDKNVTLDPVAFAQSIQTQRISILFVTTALFNALSKQQPDVFAQLDYCLFGGEACDPNQVSKVLESGSKPKHLLHVYGPTENTTFSTWFEITSVLPGSTTIPIGRPIANSTAYVLDEQRRPVPVGVPGEIYVGGMGLADGYMNRPELTSQVFVSNPFEPGSRMYKTGDLGRILEDGAIEISGRIDDQVKIRGYRIELGEIETALNLLPGVIESSVIVRAQENGSKQLVAYCESEPGNNLDVAELKSRLKQHLPFYMVPSAIVVLDKLPINPNGKVDKKALPEPTQADFVTTEFVDGRTEVERALIGIWKDVLELDRVGIYDDFFELGGHSLLINKVSTRIKQQLSIELPLRTLFEVPTIAALGEIIKAMQMPAADANDQGEWDEEEFEEGSL